MPASRIGGVCLVMLAGLLVPALADAQRLGLFFDEEATRCAAAMEPFAPGCDTLWVVAFSGGDTLAGAIFRLEMPTGLEFCAERPVMIVPAHGAANVVGDPAGDLDVQFIPCLRPGEITPIIGLRFWMSAPHRLDDVVLHLVGAREDSLHTGLKPKLKICDPRNPEGYSRLVEAQTSDANLNCTAECPCTTPVTRRTWSHVKILYRGR